MKLFKTKSNLLFTNTLAADKEGIAKHLCTIAWLMVYEASHPKQFPILTVQKLCLIVGSQSKLKRVGVYSQTIRARLYVLLKEIYTSPTKIPAPNFLRAAYT